ncbi:hypothetical protein T11_13591 [Trichinella zimbabwensis]|uniref:Uncharacterized protein n=1 Tax=Trichinella zimbabwensis TaxID=268475 RepID=A0A0V1HQA3_9BILA|nr:hypothetical protein T11_13591 [Trichinella zimbabwensis]
MLYWARWTCDRDSASEAMRTLTARDRVNSQSASFSLPNLPRPIGEQVVNSGHKAYGTATAVCHTASWLAPNDHLATIVCPPSCDITITGRLSGNEGMPPVCSAPATTGQCLCVQLCRSSSRPTGTRGGTKRGTLQVKKPLPEGKQTPALLDRYVSLQVQQRVMIPDELGCVIEEESIFENEIGRGDYSGCGHVHLRPAATKPSNAHQVQASLVAVGILFDN